MKKINIFVLSFFIVTSIFFTSTTVKAAAQFRNSETKTCYFAVPEGGWSYSTTEVVYTENYTSSGSNNILNNRNKIVYYKMSGATTRPTISLDNVKHSNGTIFTTWNIGTLYVDSSKWESGSLYANSTSVTYSKTTNITGNLPYTIACDSAVPAQYHGSVSLAFK